MEFLDKIRYYDFVIYLRLHQASNDFVFLHRFFDLFAKYGVLIPFLAFIYLIWTKRINALICSFFAMALAGIADLTIYLFWKRPRPYVTHAKQIIISPGDYTVDMTSFPSSHTYLAFAVATSIFLYGHKKLGIFLFLVATGVAISRIATGLHYPSDTIGGALLGISAGIFAYIIVHKSEKRWE